MNLFDQERFVADEVHASRRSPFERDRARILHSSALRRLGTKTQVLGAGFDDFVRTRLTHSLEVAQVGRDLANGLGAEADIVDAACLAHDLGHPPFGHNGEEALNELAKDIGGFEGNAQTLRILTRLEPKIVDENGKSAGLNLTRATLDATIKYPWKMGEKSISGSASTNKFNYYPDDAEVFNWIREGVQERFSGQKCFEAQIMDLSDDISYCVHDTEDGIVSSGVQMGTLKDDRAMSQIIAISQAWYGEAISEDDLIKARNRFNAKGYLDLYFDGTFSASAKLKNLTSSLIGRFASAALIATKEQQNGNEMSRYNAKLIVPKTTLAEIQLLKAFIATFVMQTRDQIGNQKEEQEIIKLIYKKMMTGTGLDRSFADMLERAENDSQRARIVIDQIACLTDFSAKNFSNML